MNTQDPRHEHDESVSGEETKDTQSERGEQTTSESIHEAPDDREWRLRFTVGEVVHYTAWTTEFSAIENLYDQYRRNRHGSNHVIERREVLT